MSRLAKAFIIALTVLIPGPGRSAELYEIYETPRTIGMIGCRANPPSICPPAAQREPPPMEAGRQSGRSDFMFGIRVVETTCPPKKN